MNPKDSNRLRDKIIEILQAHCTDNTGTDVRPLYPLLHWVESELHEYGKNLQGHVLDWKARYEDEIRDGELLRTKAEELQERIIECESDYKEICELSGELFRTVGPDITIMSVGIENYQIFKNHIGW